ncbi:sensor histidine kinase [Flagellimonas crocea]|uniref:sensor histidine kinase n=1 Tax=Flagellimonas crocea TaxID=3067311 RepID=UPI00296F73CF|nr:PAS domain-containing sensor histidine kinase [Muricauda sp. DH64]
MAKEKNRPNISEQSDFPGYSRELDASGDIFKQIFEYSVIPTLVHDLDMNIINANDSAIEMFGFSFQELRRMKIFDLHTHDELEHSTEVLNKMKQEKKLSVETRFKKKDGTVFIAQATPCQYILEEKPLIHVFIQDITEQKLTQKKLKESNIALKEEMTKVKRYTRQIELQNTELEEFSYVAAHDLKAPVTNLSVLSEMINVESITDSQNKELYQRLKKNVEKLHKTVYALNEVINFKAISIYDRELLKFEDILKEIKEGITEQINTAKANISADFSQCPEIEYPALHLKSIMQNLLTNSIKYRNPARPLEIEIKTTIQNGVSCLCVKDNGMGFDSSKHHEKIFKLFRRFHTHVEGMGVGMYLIKSIVDSHGGKIQVKSNPNEGALFHIYLNNESYVQ